MIRQLADNIYNIGTDTYNAYLLTGNKNVLIDVLPEKCGDILLNETERIVPTEKISYVVFTHTEPSGSGALSAILDKNPDVRVCASIAGIRNIRRLVSRGFNELVLKDGCPISADCPELVTIVTPNLTWPDTIMLYGRQNKALFSGGMFSEYSDKRALHDKLRPFADFVVGALEKIRTHEISAIYPSRGNTVGDVSRMLKEYEDAAVNYQNNNIVAVIYCSEYGCTEKAAREIAASAYDLGYDTALLNLKQDGIERAVEAVYSARAVFFGSPTINRSADASVRELLAKLERIMINKKPAAVFGSYCWSGEACGLIIRQLEMLKFDVLKKPFSFILNPTDDDLKNARAFASELLDKPF